MVRDASLGRDQVALCLQCGAIPLLPLRGGKPQKTVAAEQLPCASFAQAKRKEEGGGNTRADSFTPLSLLLDGGMQIEECFRWRSHVFGPYALSLSSHALLPPPKAYVPTSTPFPTLPPPSTHPCLIPRTVWQSCWAHDRKKSSNFEKSSRKRL